MPLGPETMRIPCPKGALAVHGPKRLRAVSPMQMGMRPLASSGVWTVSIFCPVTCPRQRARSAREALSLGSLVGGATMTHRASFSPALASVNSLPWAQSAARPQAASTATKNLLMSFLILTSSLPVDANTDDSPTHARLSEL